MRAAAPRVAHGAPTTPKKPHAPFSANKFVQGLILAVIVMALVLAAAYKILGLGPAAPEGDPEELAQQARDAIVAVKNRTLKGNMNPPSYDDILMPLDQMLREAKQKLESDGYDPIRDSEYVLDRVEPIPDIADAGHKQAMSETSFLKKEYRFMTQKGDACRYWARALWSRWEAMEEGDRDGKKFVPSAEQEKEFLAIVNNGIDADPGDKELWYLRALAERSGGGFSSALTSLQKALDLDPAYIAAWNDIGLVYINLKDFDKAEQAFVKAADLAEKAYKAANAPPGEEYVTALLNLADFHDALRSFYEHENRVNPSAENERELKRHSDELEKYAEKIRVFEPYTPPSENLLGK